MKRIMTALAAAVAVIVITENVMAELVWSTPYSYQSITTDRSTEGFHVGNGNSPVLITPSGILGGVDVNDTYGAAVYNGGTIFEAYLRKGAITNGGRMENLTYYGGTYSNIYIYYGASGNIGTLYAAANISGIDWGTVTDLVFQNGGSASSFTGTVSNVNLNDYADLTWNVNMGFTDFINSLSERCVGTHEVLNIGTLFGTNTTVTGDFHSLALVWNDIGKITWETVLDHAAGQGYNLYYNSANGAIVYNNVSSNDVPEPATLTLMGLGLAGVGFARRQRKYTVAGIGH